MTEYRDEITLKGFEARDMQARQRETAALASQQLTQHQDIPWRGFLRRLKSPGKILERVGVSWSERIPKNLKVSCPEGDKP